MKNLNKILIIIATLCCFASSLTLADNSDCWIFGNLPKQEWSQNSFIIVDEIWETNKWTANFLTTEQQQAIITKNDLNTALLNLKKYCCTNELWWIEQNLSTCRDDKELFNENSLDSPYLFDHLIDVIMRRLNWLSGENYIYTKTNMTLDDKWAARRARIVNQATSEDWAISQNIIDEYEKIRKSSSSDLWYYIAKKIDYRFDHMERWFFLDYVGWNWKGELKDESESVANALKNYNNRTLYDRYKNACALGEIFYALLDKDWKSTDGNEISKFIPKCEEIVNRQIRWESKYTARVTKNASNQFLYNYINWYTDYLYERQLNFSNVWTNSLDKRLDVIRAVPCLQRKCVK